MGAEFQVSLEVRPEGFTAGTKEATTATKNLSEETKRAGESSRQAATASEQLAEAERRRMQSAADLVRSIKLQISTLAEYQRQLVATATAEAARAVAASRVVTTQGSGSGSASVGVDPSSQLGTAIDALMAKAQQLRESVAATAAELIRSDEVAGNIAALQRRTAEMETAVGIARQGAAAERAYAEAEAVRQAISASGARPGTDQAGAVELEVRAQQQLQAQLLSIAAARELDARAAAEEAAAQQRVASSLSKLQYDKNTTTEMVAAERAGAQAVANLNVQLQVRNAQLQAGVALIGAEGQLTIVSQEGAAAIEREVVALEEQKAILAQVRTEAMELAASEAAAARETSLLGDALAEIGQALKYLVVYGALISLGQDFKQAIVAAVEFESSLMRLRTLVGLNAREVDGFRGAIRTLSLESGQSLDQNARALFAVTSSGLRGKEALDALTASAQGAAIGLGDQTTVARAAVSAMVAYGASNLSAKQALDVIIATAREGNTSVEDLAGAFGRVTAVAAAVGVKFGDLGAAVASMTRLGASAAEAVTGLRGTLSALDLKEAKTAGPALASVGLSIQQLRDIIQKQGLAQALTLLVSRFDGNNEALAKVIPNIRALAEVLSNAKSQAADYAPMQERVNAAIGHATDEAYALVKTDPGFIFRQLGAAAADAGHQLVESLLPQLVSIAQALKAAVEAGDFKGWGSLIATAFQVVTVTVNVLIAALGALPYILLAVAGSFATSAGAGVLLEGVLDSLIASVDGLTAAIARNPLGLILVVLATLGYAASQMIDSSRKASQAFLDESAAANKDSLMLAELAKQYEVVSQKQGLLQGPSKLLGGGVKGNEVVLSTNADAFMGELNRINATYAEAIRIAGDDKTAIGAAGIARQRDLSSLQAHTQGLLDNAKAWLANQAAVEGGIKNLLETATTRRDQALESYNAIAQSPDKDYAATYAPQARHRYLDAAADVNALDVKLKSHAETVATVAAVVTQEQQALDRSHVAAAGAGAAHAEAAKGVISFRQEIEKQIAVKETEAASSRKVASAELEGAAAVRMAITLGQIDKQVTEDQAKAKKDHAVYTDKMRESYTAAALALAAGNLQGEINKGILASSVSLTQQQAANLDKVSDALNRNNFASTYGNEIRKAEAEIRKLGIDALGTDGQYLDEDARKLLADADARGVNMNATTALTESIRFQQDIALKTAEALAQLADAQAQNMVASSNLKIALDAEKEARLKNYAAGSMEGVIYAAVLEAQLKSIAAIHQETEARKGLNAEQWDERKAQAQLDDLKTQLGLQKQFSPEIVKLAEKYGVFRSAVEAVTIAEEIEKATAGLTNQADIDAVSRRIIAHHQVLDAIGQEKTATELSGKAAETFGAEVQRMGDSLQQAMLDSMTGVAVDWKKMLATLLQDWIKTLIKMAEEARAAKLASQALPADQQGPPAPGSGGIGTYGGGGWAGVAGGAAVGLAGASGSAGAAQAASAAVMLGSMAAYLASSVVLAWVGVIVGVVAAIVGFIQQAQVEWAKVDLGAKDGKLVVANLRGAQDRFAGLISAAQGMLNSLNLFVSDMGGQIASLDSQVTIGRTGHKEDTQWHVTFWEAGQKITVDTGHDIKDAMELGAVEALRHSTFVGLDPLIAAVIHNSSATTMATLQQQIATAAQISDFGKSDTTLSFTKITNAMLALRNQIEQLLPPSKELTDALHKIGLEEAKQLGDLRNQILGIKQTPQEQLHQQVLDFNEALKQQNLALDTQITAAQGQLEAAQTSLIAARAQELAARAQLHAAHMDDDGSGVGLDLANSILDLQKTIDALKGQIADLQAAKGALPKPITPEEEAAAQRRLRGSGSGNTNQDQLKQIFATFNTSQLSAFAQQLQAVNDKWDAAAKLAGKNRDELAKVNADRAIEIALLEKTAVATARKNAQSYIDAGANAGTGVSPIGAQLQGLTDTSTALIQSLRDLRNAGAITTAELRKTADEIRASTIAQQQAIRGGVLANAAAFIAKGSGLDGSLSAALKSIDDTAGGLYKDLLALNQAGLLSTDAMSALTAQIYASVQAQRQATVSAAGADLLNQLYGILGMDKEAAQAKYDLTVAELEIKRAELAIAIQQYNLSAAILPVIDGLIAKVIAGGPALFASGGASSGSTQSQVDAVAQDRAMVAGIPYISAADAEKQLQAIENSLLSPTAAAVKALNDQFASLRLTMGDTARVQRDYSIALRNIMVQAFSPLQQMLDGLKLSNFSPLKQMDRLAAAQQTFESTIAAIQGGNLTHVGDIAGYAQSYLQEALASMPKDSDAYKALFDRVQREAQAIIDQYVGPAPAGSSTGTPGAPGGTPGTTPSQQQGINLAPVVGALQDTSSAQVEVLNTISRNTRDTVDGLSSVRARLDQPLGVYQRSN